MLGGVPTDGDRSFRAVPPFRGAPWRPLRSPRSPPSAAVPSLARARSEGANMPLLVPAAPVAEPKASFCDVLESNAGGRCQFFIPPVSAGRCSCCLGDPIGEPTKGVPARDPMRESKTLSPSSVGHKDSVSHSEDAIDVMSPHSDEATELGMCILVLSRSRSCATFRSTSFCLALKSWN